MKAATSDSEQANQQLQRQRERKRERRRRYYAENLDLERQRARERSIKRKDTETAQQRQERLAMHKDAQRRYREKNGRQLKTKSWVYRKQQSYNALLEKEKREDEDFMNQFEEDFNNEMQGL